MNIEETCRIAVQLTALITVVRILMYRTTDSHQTQKTRAMWVKKINRTDIAKYAFLCSNHFTEDCFDKSYEKYKKFLAKDGKKLVKGAIPMLFAHNTELNHVRHQKILLQRRNK